MNQRQIITRIRRDLIMAAVLEMRRDFRLAEAARARAAMGRAKLAIWRAAA